MCGLYAIFGGLGALFALGAAWNEGTTEQRLGCALVSIVMFAGLVWLVNSQRGVKQAAVSHYESPVVQSALWYPAECVLRMKVRTTHTRYISDEMTLPAGTYISDITRNQLYLLELPVPAEISDMSDRDVYNHAVEWARVNGFAGKVKTA